MAKAGVTRTLGPIHFEDLDPHRFEDLVRELIYDFRDWHTIEATGRSGDDAGFDVRAFERALGDSAPEPDDEDLPAIPQIGNVWMIQAKREKALGPSRIRDIISEIDAASPPYGYVLAASANISKRAYDVFRSELRAKGVAEYYLWGKGELEDMLLQPKNDRLLFAFFGVSLASRRRSRSTEIRQIVSTKNKLLRTLNEDNFGQVSVLVRDANDTHYPSQHHYRDFSSRPRWKEYVVVEQHPKGVIVSLAEHFAYVDRSAKAFACDVSCNLARTSSQLQSRDPDWHEYQSAAKRDWEHLPARMQGRFYRNGLIQYEDILVVDDKGDSLNRLPHLFVDFSRHNGPLAGSYEYAVVESEHIPLRGFKQLSKAPIPKVEPGFGTIFPANSIRLSDSQLRMLRWNRDEVQTLYDLEGHLAPLRPRDVLTIAGISSRDAEPLFLEVTHVESVSAADLFARATENAWRLEQAVGHAVGPDATVTVYETRVRYSFEIEQHSGQHSSSGDL